MVGVDGTAPVAEEPDTAAQTVFRQQWRIYRKMVDHDYLFHRGAYGRLRRILLAEIGKPFRFLDVACGDAGASAGALTDSTVTHYHGIDQSEAALDLARETLAGLSCSVTLEQRDFVEALGDRPAPADVVWIGLSLHHLRAPAKLAALRAIRGIVGEDGLLLIYENTSPDGEDRTSWLRRWDEQRPAWTAYSSEEWDTMAAHVHAADFPETVSSWHELGRAAGFTTVQEEFVAPTDLFRMYRFRV